MKKTLFTAVACGAMLIACGQNATPPTEVQKAFSEKFSTVQNPNWEQEENEWEAEFKMNGAEMSASFDNSGKWLETETEIKKADVPENILNAVNSSYNDWKIEEIARVEKPDFKGYEFELEKEEAEQDVLVTDSGEIVLIKDEVKGEDDED